MKEKKNLQNLQNLEQIVRQCARGNQKAQNQLYERFATAMFRLCYRYLENEMEAEEVLINGFLKVFQNVSKIEYQGEGSFAAWVKRIMTNEALMYIRKYKKIYWENIEDQLSLESTEETGRDLMAEDIYNLIREMPLGYRTVFNLYVIEGYNHKEIAEKLGIQVSTSKTQLKKARSFLQQKLNEHEPKQTLYNS